MISISQLLKVIKALATELIKAKALENRDEVYSSTNRIEVFENDLDCLDLDAN